MTSQMHKVSELVRRPSREETLNRDAWCILGLLIDNLSFDETMDHLDYCVQNRVQCFLSTPNTNFLVASITAYEFQQSVIQSDISVADGMTLVWVSRIIGVPIVERVAGASLFESLKSKAMKVFFFGGQDNVAEIACERVNDDGGAMSCVGHYNPGMGTVESMSTDAIRTQIRASGPDFLVVSLGARKGQAWIQKNMESLNVPVVSHLGAVVNFESNTVNRAPVLLQKMGLEWLFRIYEEPKLWSRYLSDGLDLCRLMSKKVMPLYFLHRRYRRKSKLYKETKFVTKERGSDIVLEIHGAATLDNREEFRKVCLELLSQDKPVVLEWHYLGYFDAAFLGTLMLFKRLLVENGQYLDFQNVSKSAARLLRLHGVTTYFGVQR